MQFLSRAPRCEHGFYTGLCVVLGCAHFDGHADGEWLSKGKSMRPKPTTLKCHRCNRQIPRERLDDNRACLGGCACEVRLMLMKNQRDRVLLSEITC